MISSWDFPEAEALVHAALGIAPVLARLKSRCVAAGVPVIYANDNSGQWRSDFKFVVRKSLDAGGNGAEITRLLEPTPDDYFVLKPKHSAFFATPLEILLDHLRTQRLIVVGVAADQCILNTVADARMRDFDVLVASDAIAAISAARHRRAVAQLREALEVKVSKAQAIRLQQVADGRP